MADSMYDDSGDEPEVVDSPAEEAKEDESGEETAMLPKSLFAGKEPEPGSKCTVEVVHVYEDEVEVKYVPHGTKDKPKEDMEDMPMKDKIAMAAT